MNKVIVIISAFLLFGFTRKRPREKAPGGTSSTAKSVTLAGHEDHCGQLGPQREAPLSRGEKRVRSAPKKNGAKTRANPAFPESVASPIGGCCVGVASVRATRKPAPILHFTQFHPSPRPWVLRGLFLGVAWSVAQNALFRIAVCACNFRKLRQSVAWCCVKFLRRAHVVLRPPFS